MQGAETVYEFGSSADEDDDNNGQTKSLTSATIHAKKTSQSAHQSNQTPPPSGVNLRSNRASSSSIGQKINTSYNSFSSENQSPSTAHKITGAGIGPKNAPSASNPNKTTISASDDTLLLNADRTRQNDGGSSNIAASSISNTSNTSLSSATNSSRGDVSQAGNQSTGSSSQKVIGPPSSQQHHNPNFDSNVISERVKNLATQIYQELKRIISRCNYDEDILSGLMPLIVRVLESLDLALIENQQLQVELELCKDDNEQLVIMFEKEKAAKRAIDKKLIESEYAYEEERQQYQQKIESLDNVIKMFELKAKNASDQAIRFEEKEAERKREYNKLHDRYTELLKSHCDVVERVRHLAGNNEAISLGSINVPPQMVASSSELNVGDAQQYQLGKYKSRSDESEFDRSHSTLKSTKDAMKSWNPETELTLEDASLVLIEDPIQHHPEQATGHKPGDAVSSHNDSDRAASEHEGEHEKESENDSIAYTSMEKEFRKLIQENKDLLNTKNALNVVKDDLIAEVDRLTNMVSMYEQALEQLNTAKDQMKLKVASLDAELRKTKEELDKAKQKIREVSILELWTLDSISFMSAPLVARECCKKVLSLRNLTKINSCFNISILAQNNEEGVPYAQRKRFGRAEMAKVLLERNNYKEKYMELQDAVRYTELVRANSKVETEKRSGLWKLLVYVLD